MISRAPGHGPNQTIIFQHIPKTAGSTLHTIFNRKCRRQRIHNVFGGDHSDESIEAFRRLPENHRREIDLLKGHMPFGLHRDLPQEAVYVTVLREPVARVISQYKYIRRNPGNHLHDQVVGNRMSLGDFVASGISAGMDNGQVRWLAGEVHGWDFGEIGETELERAKSHLREHYALVGLTEQFDATVLLLRQLMGWRAYPFYVKRNVSDDGRTKVSFEEEDVEIVRRHHRFDLELYEFARGLFDEQRKAAGITESSLERFVRWNDRYSFVARPWVRFTDAVKRRV